MCWQPPSIVAQSGIIAFHSASYILPAPILTVHSAPSSSVRRLQLGGAGPMDSEPVECSCH